MDTDFLVAKLLCLTLEYEDASTQFPDDSLEHLNNFGSILFCKESMSMLKAGCSVSELRSNVYRIQQLFMNDENHESEAYKSIIEVTGKIISIIDDFINVSKESIDRDNSKAVRDPLINDSNLDPEDDIDI